MHKHLCSLACLLILTLFVSCNNSQNPNLSPQEIENSEPELIYTPFLDMPPAPHLDELEAELETAPSYAQQNDDFCINNEGVIVFANEKNDGPCIFKQAEPGRTVTRTNCRITAFFGLSIYGNKSGPGNEKANIRFASTQPELFLTSNGSLTIHIRLTEAMDFPGVLTLEVGSNQPGRIPKSVTITASNMKELQQKLGQPPITWPSPDGMNAGDNRVVVEDITATAKWDPDNHDPCRVVEKLRIRWEFATPHSRFIYRTSKIKCKNRDRTGVSSGNSLTREQKPDGRVVFSVPVQTFYAIDNPDACCGIKNTSYTVIQFVRKEWNLKEAPQKKGQDTWSLDVLDGEIDRANDNPPQDYDPTFTHNPHGADPDADPLVYPGPDPSGEQSIVQTDKPGISPELYGRFKNAAAGSEFSFHFMSFLVCELNPSTAARYLQAGQIKQVIEYKVKILFRGPNREPVVSVVPIGSYTFDPCRTFNDIVTLIDKKLKNTNPPQGQLRDGYTKPRAHKVGIPK